MQYMALFQQMIGVPVHEGLTEEQSCNDSKLDSEFCK